MDDVLDSAPLLEVPEPFERGQAANDASRIVHVLDEVRAQLLKEPVAVEAPLRVLSAELRRAKSDVPASEWEQLIAVCRAHPLCALLHQDPLTARAFAKTRGYQGDAGLLDIIYDRDYRRHASEPVTPLGDAVFRHTVDCQAPRAVRERRAFLAAQIDECCARNPGAHILAAACGHLRELELSAAVQTQTFGRFVGLDQDAATLAHVRQTWGPLGVEAIPATVSAFLLGASRSRYDFIYVAGLYDYLDDSLAHSATRKLATMLRPGGRLLIGNFTGATEDAGYMEAFMDWRLIYRSGADLLTMADGTGAREASIVADSTGAVIYLDLTVA